MVDLVQGAQRLLFARSARSIGQGALVVDFALYLHALHWQNVAIGALYTASLLLGGLVTLWVGPSSDHLGTKKFLLGYEVLQLLAASIALASSHAAALTLAAILGSFGRGANGAAGPFAPVEQAWLSRLVPQEDWPRFFHRNTAMGLAGMGVGALLAALPGLLSGVVPELLSFRFLFLLVFLGAICTILLLLGVPEPRPKPHCPSPADPPSQESQSTPYRDLWLLSAINSLNGLGIGLIGPLMAYWFHLRFGVSSALIGPGMALSFFVAAVSSLMGIGLVRRFGMVGTVIRLRLVGIALLLLLPLAPTFAWAMAAYILRAAMNQGSIGSRQALFLGLVDAHRRGLAATLNSLSIQVPRAIGPSIAGVFFAAGVLSWPLFLGAGLQGLYLLAFHRFFQKRANRNGRAKDQP
ncbi:MAG: MFS transporter [Acidithiobacillus sp.]|nr:MFS transporter [Acidithiobacillus sp.]